MPTNFCDLKLDDDGWALRTAGLADPKGRSGARSRKFKHKIDTAEITSVKSTALKVN